MPSCALVLSWLFALCSLAEGAALLPGPIDPHDPPEGRFADEWSEIYMGDSKVGYAHTAMSRADDRIETRTYMKMNLGRAGEPVSISLEQAATETLSGGPLQFSTTTKMAAMDLSTRGTVQNGKVTIVTSQLGMEQTQTFDFPSGAVLTTWGAYREGLLRGFKPGTAYTLLVYAPELRLDDAVQAVTTIGDWEQVEHFDRKRRGQRVSMELNSPLATLKMVSWVDEQGRPLVARIPAPGMGDMTVVAVDQQTALTDFVPPEMFSTSVIRISRSLNPSHARRIVYRLTASSDEAELATLPSTDSQRVTVHDERSATVVVERQLHRPPDVATGQATGRSAGVVDARPYLDGNLMINTRDEALIALAARAAAGETKRYALADRLRRFVSDYVRTKSLSIGFATASEVCRTREGDCSEHAVLLAALGRLNRLPSRVVVGLVYVPVLSGERDVFGYHMWTQFLIDGRWLDVDAALGETECSPARIAFVTSSLKDSGLADLSLPLLNKIGVLAIEVLEVTEADAVRP